MNYESVKNGMTIKEVRAMKDRQRKALVNYLKGKWSYTNSTAYNNQFRNYKLIEMITEITYYLHVDDGGHNVITFNEQYILLLLIRRLSDMTSARTPDIKKDIRRRLKELEALTQ